MEDGMSIDNGAIEAIPGAIAESRRERILNAAESEFSAHGYHGASMRDIARAADVGLPLIVYHFQTKGQLYFAVFSRRDYINTQRLEALDRIRDLDAPDAVERIVAAFVDPVLDLHESEEDWAYARLILREVTEPSSGARPEIRALFEPIAKSFIGAIRAALPDKPENFHEWAYLFSVGALTVSAFDDRVGETPRTTGDLAKREALKRYLVAALRFG
jgi:AcrR family transcriptional regulator